MMRAMGTLSIVATPIGNLEDITLRALRVLQEAECIYCEDTRVTKKLLHHYNITTPLKRLDAHVEMEKVHEVIERVQGGEAIAYVSDAGTPGISDPGARLVAAARKATCHIEVVPGPSALAAALSVAGLPLHEFIFLGFPPHKKGRQTFVRDMLGESHAIILYESTHRIEKLLTEIYASAPSRLVTIARELTKTFESVVSGTASELLDDMEHNPDHVRGEFVVIIHPCE
jgi:16S rRNA (cytidine1402-2'-O)-methyltransferase